jgi:hypothetical protein
MSIFLFIVFVIYAIGNLSFIYFVLSGEGKDERGKYILSKAFTNSFISITAGYLIYLGSKIYLNVGSEVLNMIVMTWMSVVFFTVGLTILMLKKRV